MNGRREAWLEIDLEAIRRNVAVIRSVVGRAAVAPVVKADAYGHGLVAVGRALAPVSDALCVSTLDEAITLRAHVEGRILLLYPVPPEAAHEAIAAGIELPVMSGRDVEAIRRAAASATGEPVRVHLAVETGMGRGGLPPETVAAIASEVQADPRLALAGLWSHLHSPEDPPASEVQLRRFEVAGAALREARIPLPPCHIAASGGIFAADEPSLDLVRPGLAVYGVLDEAVPLVAATRQAALRLRPAMSLKAHAVAFSEVAQGRSVGYGATWRAERPSRIAVLPLGYADGYLRGTQPGASALVRGRRVPLVGRVSMDAVTADVTDLPGVDHGDEFVLLGVQGEESISAGDLARQRNTIAWEVLTSMAPRLTRVYHPTAGTGSVRDEPTGTGADIS